MAETLKIVAKKLNIRLDKGGTFNPIFYILDANNAPVNLTGHNAVMQVKQDYSDVVPIFDLTTTNGKITIVGPDLVTLYAGEELNGVILSSDLTIANVYGIQPYISAELTSAITQDTLVYNVDLIKPSLDVIKYLKGSIFLNPDGTS